MATKAQTRQIKIYQQVLYREVVRVGELAQELGVSTETIRRDLMSMEEEGLIERDHGVARIPASRSRGLMSVRQNLNAQDKQDIAQAAVGYVRDNAVVFCDGGTTGLALAKLLSRMRGLTIVTNGLSHAQLLAQSGNEAIILGGKLDARDNGALGGFACEMVDMVSFDVAFLGTDGIQGAGGPTAYITEDLDLKRHIIRKSSKVILLADYTKFDYKGTYEFCGWRDVDVLVTNEISDENRALVADVGELVVA